jgi:uncharacterized caspase-like protein
MTRRTFACITACSAWRGFAAQNRTVKPQPEAEAVPKPTITEATARRLAYVIGNNTYLKAPPLHNAAHDASDIANVLQRLGFGVTPVVEADSIEFRRTFQQFSSGLRAGDIALFFYSGHGLQIDAENYLVPIDFDPAQGELGAKATCLRASDVRTRSLAIDL